MIEAAPKAKDFTHERVQRNAPLSDVQKAKNRSKSAVRAHVEHPFFAHQATVGLRQDPLPGIGQERQSPDRDVRALQRATRGDYLGGIGVSAAGEVARNEAKSLVSRGV